MKRKEGFCIPQKVEHTGRWSFYKVAILLVSQHNREVLPSCYVRICCKNFRWREFVFSSISPCLFSWWCYFLDAIFDTLLSTWGLIYVKRKNSYLSKKSELCQCCHVLNIFWVISRNIFHKWNYIAEEKFVVVLVDLIQTNNC